MEGKTYNPASAARIVGVHPNSIRQWTATYASLLSDAATHAPRKLSAQDVAVLQAVKQLRDEGYDVDAIIYRLSQVPDSDLRQPTIDATGTPQQPTMADSTAPLAIVDSVAAVAVQIASERLSQLDARLARLERQRSIVAAAILGAVAGALLVALGIFIASLLLR